MSFERTFKISEAKSRNSTLIYELLNIWESSVRATHLFLSNEEILKIKQYVPDVLKSVPALLVAEDIDGSPVGFAGIDGSKLEMLFIAEEHRNRGIGSLLMTFSIENCGITHVDVNEDNPLAVGFYEHKGFKIIGRSELDDQGDPYPILHMCLTKEISQEEL